MNREFERENRYVVFKVKDLECLDTFSQFVFSELCKRVNSIITQRGKDGIGYVVVESDWPEYETVWQMIESRITNSVSGEVDENTATRFRGILSMLGISAPESDESLMLFQFSLLGMIRHKIQQIYDQPDRTAQLEAKLAERDEEIERLQSYEQGLNDVIAWMKERGLYHDADYFGEGADFAAILTEHEQQVSAQSDRKLDADNKRLVEALTSTNGFLDASSCFQLQQLNSNAALLAEMEAKG